MSYYHHTENVITTFQEQELEEVGLHLQDEIYCHEWLYVAVAHTMSNGDIKMACLVQPTHPP